jgi:8-oxo-dGTP diphosphatase
MKNVAVGIIMNNGRILACQRKRTVRYPLKWEFPGGKIEPGETAHEAVVRELQEELGIDAIPDRILLVHDWTYTEGAQSPVHEAHFRVTYFMIHAFTGEPENRTFESIRWVSPGELQSMDILEGNRQAVALLLQQPAHAPSHG